MHDREQLRGSLNWVVVLMDAVGWRRYRAVDQPPGDTLTVEVSEDRPLWMQHWRLSRGVALFDRVRERDATGVSVYRWRPETGR